MQHTTDEGERKMRRAFWISAIAAALMLSACSEQTKEDVKQAAQSVAKDTATQVETVKAKSSEAMEEAKRQASEALESAKERAREGKEAVQAKSSEAAAAVEKKAGELKERLAPAQAEAPHSASPAAQTVAPVKDGKALYGKCAGCHGVDGKTKALGKAPVIAGQKAEVLKKLLEEYKAGERNAYGMGTLMQGQVAGLSESELAALADYISKL
jgi:cytochrome c553